MANITIYNHGTINIYDEHNHTVAEARNELLHKMYYARYKQTLGGYEGWLKLLDLYYSGDYKGMLKHLKSCKGKGGATRSQCMQKIKLIMEQEGRN